MRIGILILICLICVKCDNYQPKQQESPRTSFSDQETSDSIPKDEKIWEKVAKLGGITTVYMPPEAFSDKYLIAEILDSLRIQFPIQQIWFYDDRTKTPTHAPMTDEQMIHWRAKYAINLNSDYEEFVFITVTNPNTSPPEISTIRANIRPGFAE